MKRLVGRNQVLNKIGKLEKKYAYVHVVVEESNDPNVLGRALNSVTKQDLINNVVLDIQIKTLKELIEWDGDLDD